MEFYGSVNLNHLAFEQAHIPDILEVRSEDHDGKRASRPVFAEVYEMIAVIFYYHVQHLAGYALDLADVLTGIVNGHAVGSEQRCGRQDEQEDEQAIRQSPIALVVDTHVIRDFMEARGQVSVMEGSLYSQESRNETFVGRHRGRR